MPYFKKESLYFIHIPKQEERVLKNILRNAII